MMTDRTLSPRAVALRISSAKLRQSEQALARLLKRRAMSGTRDWRTERRDRTRHLIELGGLVQKAGLVELTEDDRATVLGALLEAADALRGLGRHDERPADLRALWRRRGLRAFDADAEQSGRGTRKEERGRSYPAAELR